MGQEQTETFGGTTHIAVVLDKSGSMGSVRRETIDGFNSWLAKMQSETGDFRLTLTLFDTTFSTPFQEADIAKVNPLDESRYMPSGNTALLDGTADAIAALAGVETKNGSDRYLVCIVTDGEENASKRTTKEDLAALVKEKESTGRWTFTYLSAAPDAFADAQSIGVQSRNTMAYTGDAAGTVKGFAAVAGATLSYGRSANLCSNDFYGGAQHANDLDNLAGAPPTVGPTTTKAKTAGVDSGWLKGANQSSATGWLSR